MIERSYSFATLRYIHDPITGEFVNVGVVLFAPKCGGQKAVILGKTSHRIGRLRFMFPDIYRGDFRDAMNRIDRSISKAVGLFSKSDLFEAELDARSIVRSILPDDDSSLQWSEIGSGVTFDLEKAFQRIFERYVSKYDVANRPRRSDDDVWKPVRALLEQREIDLHLEEKTIIASDDSIDFKHAWKNGIWHVYEPLSLDLAEEDGIMQKARKWLGNLASVQDTSEEFVAHFIVGAPTDPHLMPAYVKAMRILSKAPVSTRVYEEQNVHQLVNEMEAELAMHRSSLSH